MKSMLHREEAQALPPAVVVGGELNALGVCRSLGMAGVPTYVVDRKRLNAAMWCRYATPVRVRALHGAGLVEALQSTQRRAGGHPVLIVTDEMALLTISEHRDQLKALFRFGLPAHDKVMMLHNKARFHEYASASGFPVPNAQVIREDGDFQHVRRLRFPVMIKLADKRYFHAGQAPRLIRARNSEEAVSAGRQLCRITSEIVVQECVDGPDSNIYFCLFHRAAGGTTSMFTGRKLASWPRGAGSTALCTAAGELGRSLERTTCAILERVDYLGFGSIEYKWDRALGRFLIIEPTVGRTDWQEEIATLCGANIPLTGYCRECGFPAPRPEPVRSRIVWQSSVADRLKTGTEAVSPGATVIDGYWRTDDPMPAIAHYSREMIVSAPAVLGAWSRRFAQRWIGRISRLYKPVRPA